jgi:hypothetical protein
MCGCALTFSLACQSKKTETDRYAPFVIAATDLPDELENLNIQGLKRVPEEDERIIFLANHLNEIWIQSGEAAVHRKPDIVIMRVNDMAGPYSYTPLMKDWGMMKLYATSGAKLQSFHQILACVEFKAARPDLKMKVCLEEDTQLFNEMDPMHIIVDGHAVGAAKGRRRREAS